MAIQCSVCGGRLTVNGGDKAICDQCGMQYSLSALREQLGKSSAPAQAPSDTTSSNSVNLLRLAKSELIAKKYAEAGRICQQILSTDYENTDAWELRISAASYANNPKALIGYIQEYLRILKTDEQKETATQVCSKALKNAYVNYYDYLDCAVTLKASSPVLAEEMVCRIINNCAEYTASSLKEIQRGLDKERKSRPESNSESNPEMLSVRYSIGNWAEDASLFFKNLDRITPLCRITATKQLQQLCDCVDNMLKVLSEGQEWNATFKGFEYVNGMKFPRYSHSLAPLYDDPRNVFKSTYAGVQKARSFVSRNLAAFEASEARALKARMDQYWSQRPQEKAKLEADIKDLNQKISVIKKSANMESFAARRSEAKKKLSAFEYDLSQAGLFAFKEKKALRQAIEDMERQIQHIDADEARQQEELDKKLRPLNNEVEILTKKLTGK